MARRSAGVSALHRHLRILESFDAWHPYMTLSEIADAADLARSSAHRLVGELEREGLLERLPDRTYRLGVRLWEFASRTPGAVGLREIARPWVEALHERVRQHVQLGVLSGADVLFIDRMSMPDAVLNATLIGGRIPAHASSGGLVLLAHAPPSALAQVAERGLRTYTSETIVSATRLAETLARVRSEGYAVTNGHIHPESRGVAVPVKGADDTVYAALGVVVPNDGSSPHALVELLRRAAAGVSRDLAAAYRPDADEQVHGIRSLVSGSRRSLEYLESLSPASRDERGVTGPTQTSPR